ncbi:sororin-B-like [Platysternon megacephalum]|uniref:Sororin-B-like n=1 Tax=Platysternon megacephalum TaxID=55544 RepID=A0A4D9F330_9SAUR|nr:sororin-B-like [Platysternon megacephalum]
MLLTNRNSPRIFMNSSGNKLNKSSCGLLQEKHGMSLPAPFSLFSSKPMQKINRTEHKKQLREGSSSGFCLQGLLETEGRKAVVCTLCCNVLMSFIFPLSARKPPFLTYPNYCIIPHKTSLLQELRTASHPLFSKIATHRLGR